MSNNSPSDSNNSTWFPSDNYVDLTSKYLDNVHEDLKLLPIMYNEEKNILFYIKFLFFVLVIYTISIFCVYFYYNYNPNKSSFISSF